MLAVNAFATSPSVAVVFVVAACWPRPRRCSDPRREALLPRTVRHDELTAANALFSLGMQIGLLVGPGASAAC